MLQPHRRREADDRRLGPGHGKPHLDPFLQLGQVIAGVGGAVVEREMLAAVDHFLGGERLDFLGQLRFRAVAELRTLSTKNASPIGKVADNAL